MATTQETVTARAAAPPAAGSNGMKWIGLAGAIALALIIMLIPTPARFGHTRPLVLAISAFTGAIMVPIAWAVVQSLGIKPGSKGSALIIITTVEMAVVPGVGLLYSSLNGPVIQSVFQNKNIPLSYFGYAGVMALPTLIICIGII